MDETQHYFAYGSNMNRKRMIERGVRFDHADSAVLSNFQLRFNKRSVTMHGSGAANVVPAPGARVEGVLYRLLDRDQIELMDPFEGYPKGYRRELLPVQLPGGGRAAAWVYIANAQYIDDALKPRRAYLQHLLAGKSYLSQAYFACLQQVKCLDDGPPAPERV